MANAKLVLCPPCSACGTRVIADGERRVCPRCGALFTVELASAAPAGVYREATVVELVPVREREGAPWTRTLHVHQTPGACLDVSIGKPAARAQRRAPGGLAGPPGPRHRGCTQGGQR
jgi:hypothetical protein